MRRIVVLGHVDHGKSTLIGRLLVEGGALSAARAKEIQDASLARGLAHTEWAFALDSLQSERNQGITLNITERRLKLGNEEILLIDAPGHAEFLHHMASGAASADGAWILVDATQGIGAQTLAHMALLPLLGVRHVMLVVTKMDAAGYREAVFREVVEAFTKALETHDLLLLASIPLSAKEGEQLMQKSRHMPWYEGGALIEQISLFPAQPAVENEALCLPLQAVYKFDERRILAGTIASGALQVGDEISFSPSGKTSRIASIECWPAQSQSFAKKGDAVGITLTSPRFVERGEIISHCRHVPITAQKFAATCFWLGQSTLHLHDEVSVRIATQNVKAHVTAIEHKRTLIGEEEAGNALSYGHTARLHFHCHTPVALHTSSSGTFENSILSKIVIFHENEPAGGGIILEEGLEPLAAKVARDITPVNHAVTRAARAKRNGHESGVIWLTGLSGAGKTTLALAAEKQLFAQGYQVFVLDGDNLRDGINSDLDFTPAARQENIRRAAEIAALLVESGQLVIASFVSPIAADRAFARAKLEGSFHEIYLQADSAACEKRDTKGLYARARKGEIKNFTGISAPYEIPQYAEYVIDTMSQNPSYSIAELVNYILKAFPL